MKNVTKNIAKLLVGFLMMLSFSHVSYGQGEGGGANGEGIGGDSNGLGGMSGDGGIGGGMGSGDDGKVSGFTSDTSGYAPTSSSAVIGAAVNVDFGAPLGITVTVDVPSSIGPTAPTVDNAFSSFTAPIPHEVVTVFAMVAIEVTVSTKSGKAMTQEQIDTMAALANQNGKFDKAVDMEAPAPGSPSGKMSGSFENTAITAQEVQGTIAAAAAAAGLNASFGAGFSSAPANSGSATSSGSSQGLMSGFGLTPGGALSSTTR